MVGAHYCITHPDVAFLCWYWKWCCFADSEGSEAGGDVEAQPYVPHQEQLYETVAEIYDDGTQVRLCSFWTSFCFKILDMAFFFVQSTPVK